MIGRERGVLKPFKGGKRSNQNLAQGCKKGSE